MDGETLYEIYANKMEDQGTGVDEWADLAETDRNAWEAVASACLAAD
jgi:hypothetical protein